MFEEAVENYKIAIKWKINFRYNPKIANYYSNLASSYYQLKMFEEAVENYLNAISYI